MTLKQMCEAIATKLTEQGSPITEAQVCSMLSPTGETAAIVDLHRELCRPAIEARPNPVVGDLRSVHGQDGEVLCYEAFTGFGWVLY